MSIKGEKSVKEVGDGRLVKEVQESNSGGRCSCPV